MKPWLWSALGLLVLVAVCVLIVMYRALTVKVVPPSRSPLAQAVFDADTARARTLLNAGADANSMMDVSYQIAPGGNISTSFRVSIMGGSRPKAGMSVLAFASFQCNQDIIRLLLDKGADVNGTDEYGHTPLILAAWIGDVETVQLLLNRHADVNMCDYSGKTALMWAQAEGHKDVVEVLKSAAATE